MGNILDVVILTDLHIFHFIFDPYKLKINKLICKDSVTHVFAV